jgi:hypothetical protein
MTYEEANDCRDLLVPFLLKTAKNRLALSGPSAKQIIYDLVSCLVEIEKNNHTIKDGCWFLSPDVAFRIRNLDCPDGCPYFEEMENGKLWGYRYIVLKEGDGLLLFCDLSSIHFEMAARFKGDEISVVGNS